MDTQRKQRIVSWAGIVGTVICATFTTKFLIGGCVGAGLGGFLGALIFGGLAELLIPTDNGMDEKVISLNLSKEDTNDEEDTN